MFKSIRKAFGITCAPIITAIVVATFAGALAVFLPGMPDMKAGPQAEAAAADRARQG
jgi:hypothetical protein